MTDDSPSPGLPDDSLDPGLLDALLAVEDITLTDDDSLSPGLLDALLACDDRGAVIRDPSDPDPDLDAPGGL